MQLYFWRIQFTKYLLRNWTFCLDKSVAIIIINFTYSVDSIYCYYDVVYIYTGQND